MSVYEYARRERMSAAEYDRERRRAIRERARATRQDSAYMRFLATYDYERFVADRRIGPRVAFQRLERLRRQKGA